MKRPKLNEVDVIEIAFEPGVILTMRPNQWDHLLDAAYKNGSLLLEVDENEILLRAFQKVIEEENNGQNTL